MTTPTKGLRVLALDPGNHCGCAWRYLDGSFDTVMYYEREADVFDLVLTQPKILVIETFHTSGNISKYGLYTVDLIGGVKALCWNHHIPIVYHEPYIRNPYLAQAQTDLVALRKGHKFVVHEQDALAHLLAYEHRSGKGLDVANTGTGKRAVHGPPIHGGGVQQPKFTRASIISKLRPD